MYKIINLLLDRVTVSIYEDCNLSCKFCPISQGFGCKEYKMNIDTFKIIVKHLDGYTGTVSLTSRGESLLHPKFKEFVKILHHKDRTYKSYINHNSTLIDKFKDDLLMFDKIYLNVYNKFLYDKIKNKYNSIYKIKIHYYDDINEKTLRWSNRGGFLNDKTLNQKCDLPTKRIFIDWNGDYKLCCNDWKYDITMSSIFNLSIPEYYIYINKSLKVKQLLEGNRNEIPCSQCDFCGIHSKLD